MLMTPARQQRKASKTCKLNWRNKKQPAAVAPRKGNCATGCHFRPYSFASSPFDDFADSKNSTRQTECQGVSAPPHGRPPTTGCIESRRDDGNSQEISSLKQRWPNQRRFSKGKTCNQRNASRGKLSPKPVTSAALQPISIAASPPPAFPRIGDAPWAFRPFRSHRRPRLGPFALSTRISPAASRPSAFPSRSALRHRAFRLPPFPTPHTHTFRNLWMPVPHRPSRGLWLFNIFRHYGVCAA